MYKTARNLTVLGIGLSASAVVGWLLLRERKRDREFPHITVRSQNLPSEPAEIAQIVLPLVSLDVEEADSPTAEGDDLTLITDIGPRFADALHAVGITRFSQLAAQTPDALSEQLAPYATVRAQRIRGKDWIGQAARLAKR